MTNTREPMKHRIEASNANGSNNSANMCQCHTYIARHRFIMCDCISYLAHPSYNFPVIKIRGIPHRIITTAIRNVCTLWYTSLLITYHCWNTDCRRYCHGYWSNNTTNSCSHQYQWLSMHWINDWTNTLNSSHDHSDELLASFEFGFLWRSFMALACWSYHWFMMDLSLGYWYIVVLNVNNSNWGIIHWDCNGHTPWILSFWYDQFVIKYGRNKCIGIDLE